MHRRLQGSVFSFSDVMLIYVLEYQHCVSLSIAIYRSSERTTGNKKKKVPRILHTK